MPSRLSHNPLSTKTHRCHKASTHECLPTNSRNPSKIVTPNNILEPFVNIEEIKIEKERKKESVHIIEVLYT